VWLVVNLLFLIFPLSSCSKKQVITEEEVVPIIDPVRKRAQEITSAMDERLLAAQVLISGIGGSASLTPNNIEMFTEIPPGGIMFFRYNLNSDNETIRGFLTEADSLITQEAGIPPFMAVDHEGGTVNRFRRGTASLPAASSYWEIFLTEGLSHALDKIKTDSFQAGRELNELGFNMNFAPVVEHLVDENRDFLFSRSYGPDPAFTALAAAAFIQGMEQTGVLCVSKHFPGSAGPDPHYSLSIINRNRDELDLLILPFSILINSGTRAIMAAHTLVPQVDNVISSLSSVILQNWLRGDLGFDGIIISDDFIMAAAGDLNPEDAAVRSIAAGSDMILVWPGHLRQTHGAIISALEDGRLSHDRLFDAAQRIIYEKLVLGLLE